MPCHLVIASNIFFSPTPPTTIITTTTTTVHVFVAWPVEKTRETFSQMILFEYFEQCQFTTRMGSMYVGVFNVYPSTDQTS